MTTRYGYASSSDSESWDGNCPTWWSAAMEWAEQEEDDVEDRARYIAECTAPGAVVTDEHRKAVTCGVCLVRPPRPVHTLLSDHDAQDLLRRLTEDHDDYMGEHVDETWPTTKKDVWHDLTQELRCTIEAWMHRHQLAPKWWNCDNCCEVSLGDAYLAQDLATKIDVAGWQRTPYDAARWFEPGDPVDDGKAVELKAYTVYAAARKLNLLPAGCRIPVRIP